MEGLLEKTLFHSRFLTPNSQLRTCKKEGWEIVQVTRRKNNTINTNVKKSNHKKTYAWKIATHIQK